MVRRAACGSRGERDVTTRARAVPGRLLEAIAASVRTTVAVRRARVPIDEVARAAEQRQPDCRRFREAIARDGRVNVIAECKRRSPARGVLARAYAPSEIARVYERAGAAAISVLTEPTFFDGALAHLEAVKAATSLPLLRKDFILDEYQLYEARAAGADAVLLIVALLDGGALRHLARRAGHLGLETLVEVHSSWELAVARDAGADVIGVNSRDLRTLAVDMRVCDALIQEAPPGCVMVAESGIRLRQDIDRLAACGYRAFLIGEHLMTAPDPAAALAGLVGAAGGGDLQARGVGGR
jgi:indole-3-glycerol phosphate synthase